MATSLPQILYDNGYHTYMAGKWHLGMTPSSLPAGQGFESSLALMESGADNWEHKTYIPLYENAHFFKDFEPFQMPEAASIQVHFTPII